MITVSSNEISEKTKLNLAIILRKKKVLKIEKEIKELREWKVVLRVELRKAISEENNQQIVNITELIGQNNKEIKEKNQEITDIVKGIQRRYIRLLDIRIESGGI